MTLQRVKARSEERVTVPKEKLTFPSRSAGGIGRLSPAVPRPCVQLFDNSSACACPGVQRSLPPVWARQYLRRINNA